MELSWPRGPRWRAMWYISLGSKNLFQRAILYRHKKIYQCQGRLQAISRRNYVYICDGFSSISQDWSIRLGPRLVWHKILSVCFSGLQRGHPENPYEKDLGETRFVHLMQMWQISWSEAVWQGPMAGSGPRGPRWRAMWYCTWLEELVSKSNTIQTQEDISVSGKIAGNIKAKLCIYLWWFFINISGLVNSFGPTSCVAQDIISLLQWIAAGSSRKSIWERFRWDKVCALDANVTDFMIGGR